MKILYINSSVYDFLTASIIEGLNALSKEMPLELICTAQANYARRYQVWSRDRIRRNHGRFDLVILGTNRGVDTELFQDLDCSSRAICIDGADSPEFAHPPQHFCLYFKRELLVAPSANILPCPFAVERRWLYPLSKRIKYFLSACFGPTTPCRTRLLEFLGSLRLDNTHVGVVRQNRWQAIAGICRGQSSFHAALQHRFAVGHNSRYYQVLQASRLALAPHGEGVDTARWWEILGCGSVLVAPESRLCMPFPFVPGEHYLSYASHDDLAEKLSWANGNRAEVNRIQLAARSHVLRHHTSKERARQIVETYLQWRDGNPRPSRRSGDDDNVSATIDARRCRLHGQIGQS